MRTLVLLLTAAVLEVGGDALTRLGVKGINRGGFVLGALALALYGLTVNLPKWDFGRLLGVYIALFFVVSQVIAVVGFHEKLKAPVLAGGALIVAGGLVVTLFGGR